MRNQPTHTTIRIAVVCVLAFSLPDILAHAEETYHPSGAKEPWVSSSPVISMSASMEQALSRVIPTVVNVRAISWSPRFNTNYTYADSRSYDSLRDFFGREFLDQFFDQRSPTRGSEQRSLGSGVIISSDGQVLTNAHLVAYVDEIKVVLHDGRVVAGEVLGADLQTDLALLRIAGTDLVPAKRAESHSVHIGQPLLAVGNPFGLGTVVSAGIVAVLGRGNPGIATYEDFLQTDIAIHLGNTGGPLINVAGEVVAIATNRPWSGNANPGHGFAVPITMATSICKQLEQAGEYARPTLGIIPQNLTKDLAASFGFEGTDGVLVADVTLGGPAKDAGLRSGDILTGIDGVPTVGTNAFREYVAQCTPKQTVSLQYVRRGQRQSTEVTVGTAPAKGPVKTWRSKPQGFGLVLQTVPPSEADSLGSERTSGVRVTHVEGGSIGGRCGLLAGDVIVAVGEQFIDSVDAFHAAIRQHDLKRGVHLQVSRDGVSRFLLLHR